MIAQTSLDAYIGIRDTLNARQAVILSFIRHNGEVCNLDIAEGLDWPINSVTPRVLELRNMFLIESAGRRLSKTGKAAFFWRVNPQLKHSKLSCEKSRTVRVSSAGARRVTQGSLFPGEV